MSGVSTEGWDLDARGDPIPPQWPIWVAHGENSFVTRLDGRRHDVQLGYSLRHARAPDYFIFRPMPDEQPGVTPALRIVRRCTLSVSQLERAWVLRYPTDDLRAQALERFKASLPSELAKLAVLERL